MERADRGFGLGAEDAVLATGIESERIEAVLQGDHVVAAQHGLAQVQQAVPGREATLDERAPRLRPADAVDAQTALLLKRADGSLGAGVEATVYHDTRADGHEALLEIPHRIAAVACSEQRRSAQRKIESRSVKR